MPYVALQQMLDDHMFWGVHTYTKGLYLDDLSGSAVEVVSDQAARRRAGLSQILIFRMGGAYAEVGDGDTAWSGRRDVKYAMVIEALAAEHETFVGERQWARDTWEALLPLADGPGTYVNILPEADERIVRASYGEAKYERLARIKADYDPGNVFTINVNIKPA
jgi:hypothetical protein